MKEFHAQVLLFCINDSNVNLIEGRELKHKLSHRVQFNI